MKKLVLAIPVFVAVLLGSWFTDSPAARSTWSLEGRAGFSRTARTLSGLPAEVQVDGSGYVTPLVGLEVWYASRLPFELGSGFYFAARGYDATTIEGTATITYTAREPYASIPLLARRSWWKGRLYVLGGPSLDIYGLPIEDDARRRFVLALQGGVGICYGRAMFDVRYVEDMTDAVRLETQVSTVEESYDGVRVSLGYRFLGH